MGPINFLVKLHVDFARIPAYILKVREVFEES